jgi:hypothetical protein
MKGLSAAFRAMIAGLAINLVDGNHAAKAIGNVAIVEVWISVWRLFHSAPMLRIFVANKVALNAGLS